MIPFPQLNFDSGSSSGSNPYFVGPKNAPCELARNSATPAQPMLPRASAHVASTITNTSPTFVAIVTVPLAVSIRQKSARYGKQQEGN